MPGHIWDEICVGISELCRARVSMHNWPQLV